MYLTLNPFFLSNFVFLNAYFNFRLKMAAKVANLAKQVPVLVEFAKPKLATFVKYAKVNAILPDAEHLFNQPLP